YLLAMSSAREGFCFFHFSASLPVNCIIHHYSANIFPLPEPFKNYSYIQPISALALCCMVALYF
ncbi:MAG TPA: hypothetical protein PKN86_15300, partial [Candidatus Obscuribacter sp.]|nr:hypothetical protein [Candidatus Obscuribacter sp.]